jgi:hypothetical protein
MDLRERRNEEPGLPQQLKCDLHVGSRFTKNPGEATCCVVSGQWPTTVVQTGFGPGRRTGYLGGEFDVPSSEDP